ncbi:MAG TPA: TIGR00266 family protein [Polyangiaceae bacterium]|nr:TIGR00266 family protein [Polyangiaceae bacterium]
MQYRVEHGPVFAWLRVTLAAGESVQAEAGAMVTRTPALEMKTRLNAGRRAGFFRVIVAFFVALVRKFIGGETMFVNEFGGPAGGEVVVAPSLSGHIVQKTLSGGRRLFVQRGSYLASTGDVDTRVRFGGLRTLLGGEGLVLLECVGDGEVFVNSYGGITEIPVDGRFVVDTGHIVAFDGTLDFRVRSVGGVKSFLFSGEGLVCEFSGRGTVYVQSRNLGALVSWLTPLLPG